MLFPMKCGLNSLKKKSGFVEGISAAPGIDGSRCSGPVSTRSNHADNEPAVTSSDNWRGGLFGTSPKHPNIWTALPMLSCPECPPLPQAFKTVWHISEHQAEGNKLVAGKRYDFQLKKKADGGWELADKYMLGCRLRSVRKGRCAWLRVRSRG